jgi:hypothetical protein
MNKAGPENPHSQQKIEQAKKFIELELEPERAFKAAVITESVAQGDARQTSDIDMIVLFDPLRLDVIPGDFLWSPDARDFLTRHAKGRADTDNMVHFDTNRVALSDYRKGICPEFSRYLLAIGLLIFDRDGEVESVLDHLAEFTDARRQERVAKNVYNVNYHLDEAKALSWLERSGPVAAHAHVNAGLNYLVELLFAFHRSWLTWPNKRMALLLRFPDVVGELKPTLEQGMLVLSLTGEDIRRRVSVLRRYFDRLVEVLQNEGLLPREEPFDFAFGFEYPQIGMRHSMGEWQEAHTQYRLSRGI